MWQIRLFMGTAYTSTSGRSSPRSSWTYRPSTWVFEEREEQSVIRLSLLEEAATGAKTPEEIASVYKVTWV